MFLNINPEYIYQELRVGPVAQEIGPRVFYAEDRGFKTILGRVIQSTMKITLFLTKINIFRPGIQEHTLFFVF